MSAAGTVLLTILMSSAAHQLLVLDERQIGLDAGGVAIHHEADGAGGGDHGHLGVAVSVTPAGFVGIVPALLRALIERGGNVVAIDASHRVAMHADDFEERLLVDGVAFERAGGFGGDARTGEVRLAAHDGGDGAGEIAALVAIVGDAHGHQERAQVGEAEPQRAEGVGVLADFLGGVAGVIDNDFLRHDHGVDGVAEGFDVELAIGADELHQVQGRKVAGRIVQEHVLGARVGGVDARRVLARVPAVDGGIELHAGVAALVGGFGDSAQDLARLVALHGLAGGHALGPPIAIARGGFHEIVGGAYGIVGVLEEDGAVGVAIERGIVAGLDQGVGFLLFLGLAPDELLDIGVVGVEDHHFGGAAGLAAGLDDAGESVEALHKGERSGGAAAARQNGVFLAQGRKVRAGARAPLEEHALGLGQIEDGFERILHGDDEAGRALRAHDARFELGDARRPAYRRSSRSRGSRSRRH